MKISITIMAHPKRRKEAEALLVKLAKYPFKQCYITWDQKNDEWHTGERALRAGIAVNSDWHIVLQDDAIICDNFYAQVENAIKYVPGQTIISLYTGKVRPFPSRVTNAVKKAKNASWLEGNMLFWGVGILIPTRHIEKVLDFVEGRTENYDVRVGVAFQRNRLPVFYTNPSLVDHNDNIGSLLNNDYDPERRVAHNFAADRHIEWNSEVVPI